MGDEKKLPADDPQAGTIDDPNVTDPYAHLRQEEKRNDVTGDDEDATEPTTGEEGEQATPGPGEQAGY